MIQTTSHVIVGIRYHLRPGTYIKSGDTVGLIPEPDNEYDSNAIAVYLDEQKIGYIKASEAVSLAEHLNNENITVHSYIHSIDINCKIIIHVQKHQF